MQPQEIPLKRLLQAVWFLLLIAQFKVAVMVPVGEQQLAMCYMHHLLSSKKRRDIRHWAEELSIRGFVKCGYPGILVVEGLQSDLHEYLARLKALPWAAFQVESPSCTTLQRCMTSPCAGRDHGQQRFVCWKVLVSCSLMHTNQQSFPCEHIQRHRLLVSCKG